MEQPEPGSSSSDSEVEEDDDVMDLGPEPFRTKPLGNAPSFPPMTEPDADWTSEECFYELKSSVESFPLEEFVSLVDELCRKFPKWRERLVLKDIKAFALFIVHELERRRGTWRKWCVKATSRCPDVPGGFRFRLICSSHGWAKPKPAVAPPGKKQRNRKTMKCGCNRSATLSMGFSIRGKHVCGRQTPANHTKSLRVFRGMMGTASKVALWEEMEEIWKTSPNPESLRNFLRNKLPDVDSSVIQQYIEDLKRHNKR